MEPISFFAKKDKGESGTWLQEKKADKRSILRPKFQDCMLILPFEINEK